MKGLFTQGVAVLFSEPPSLAQLRGLLEDYEITSENPLGTSHWETESASFRIACRPEVGGYCLLDIVSRSWPDHLSNSEREPSLYTAWSMGHFGPFASSGSLARAIEHAHRWQHAAQLAPQHLAFVRMRIGYILGNGQGGLPPEYDSLPELEWLIRLARHVSKHARSLAYFNPNGEVLLTPDDLQKVLDDAAHSEAPPLEAIVNVRLANLAGWQLVDTIGMGQLDLPDQEIVCPLGVSSSEELSAFLFDAAYHMATTEVPIVTDNSTTGPGGTEWVATRRISSLREPARQIIHWTETEGPYEPEEFFVAAVEEVEYEHSEEPYSAIDDPANWEVPQPTIASLGKKAFLGRPATSQSAEERRRRHGCLWLLVIAFIVGAAATAWLQPIVVKLYRQLNPVPVAEEEHPSDWDETTAAVLQNWQPNTGLEAKAQIVHAGYHTLTGEGRIASGFIMRYGAAPIFCAVTTLHQFEGKTPASLDGPVGLKVLLDNINVIKLRDVQVQQVTDVSRPFECLEYDPNFTLKPGDELVIATGDGEAVKGKMANSLLMIDRFVSTPGHSRNFNLKLEKPFEYKGFSGSPIIHAATGKVVGVLREGDNSKTVIGFETLSLGPPPGSQPPPPAASPKGARK
ncbi:MAG: hypothetical protein JWO89_3100 [Verrucomicrobiaceae bacterium]|nr:hypothetical protein [Verrucomicrobiaceae bacterium]